MKTFGIGRESLTLTDGVTIGLYGPERSIIDVFRLRHLKGQEVGVEAVRRWLRRRGAQPSHLLAMAQSFPKAQPAVRSTLEILLWQRAVGRRGQPSLDTYLDLQNLARRQHRPTDELQQLYALEGFLFRLTRSPHSDRLVLKGGVLLAAYDARRPTRDVDIQALALAGEREYVLQMIRAIAITPMDDGLVFNTHGATADVIRDEDECSGVRITMTATLASAELSLHIDVSVGDPIIPAPRLVNLPRLLGGSICVIGYPLPMVYAEKTMTVVQPGTVNTRWRDFADLFVLSGRNPVDGDEVQEALSAVATYRNVAPTTLAVALDGFAALAQSRWFAWRRKQHLDDRLPSAFAHVLDAVVAFADPPLKGAVSGKTWDPPPDHGRHRSIETVPTAL